MDWKIFATGGIVIAVILIIIASPTGPFSSVNGPGISLVKERNIGFETTLSDYEIESFRISGNDILLIGVISGKISDADFNTNGNVNLSIFRGTLERDGNDYLVKGDFKSATTTLGVGFENSGTIDVRLKGTIEIDDYEFKRIDIKKTSGNLESGKVSIELVNEPILIDNIIGDFKLSNNLKITGMASYIDVPETKVKLSN